MKVVEKTREQLIKLIDSLQKQIRMMGKLQPRLEDKERELKELSGNLESRVESRTSAERVVHKQLHHEIEHRKLTEQVVEDALEFANSIIDTIREPLLVLDADLRVISASCSFYQIFKVKPVETEMQHIYELGDRQWDIPKLRELLEDILRKTTSFDDFEVEHNFSTIGKRIMLLNARKIYQKSNHAPLILLAIEDVTERKGLEEKLKDLASHDELTGCVNFRSIMGFLENEIARSRRYNKKFSIIMIDLDQFKRVNDEHGHLAGNDVLIAFADVVEKSVRSTDIVGRYGGDEFMIILPETDARQAEVFLERIRSNLKVAKIASPHLQKEIELGLEFSAGIAGFPDNGKVLRELIGFADKSLRHTKQEER